MNNERPNPFVTHVNLSPLLHTNTKERLIKRSRSNSTKNDDSKGKLFPYFHVKPFIVTFCRICLWNKRNLYIPIGAAWSCLLQFSRFVFWFRDLFLVELTDMLGVIGCLNYSTTMKANIHIDVISVVTAPCNYRNDRTNTQFSDCLWFCV